MGSQLDTPSLISKSNSNFKSLKLNRWPKVKSLLNQHTHSLREDYSSLQEVYVVISSGKTACIFMTLKMLNFMISETHHWRILKHSLSAHRCQQNILTLSVLSFAEWILILTIQRSTGIIRTKTNGRLLFKTYLTQKRAVRSQLLKLFHSNLAFIISSLWEEEMRRKRKIRSMSTKLTQEEFRRKSQRSSNVTTGWQGTSFLRISGLLLRKMIQPSSCMCLAGMAHTLLIWATMKMMTVLF